MAASAFKQNRSSFVAPTLPPTSNAFYHHCQRSARQIQIWYQVYLSDMTIEPIDKWEGYETVEGRIQLKWLSISHLPSDPRLSVCGKCSSSCQRCSCAKKGIVCTLLCKCSIAKCQNRNHVCIEYCSRLSNIHFLHFLQECTSFGSELDVSR